MFFPLFLNLESKDILVVGAGLVAFRKIEKLLEFKPKITVIAPKAIPEILSLHKKDIINFKKRKFKKSDLRGRFMVIVASNDILLQKQIYKYCIRHNIHCNSVDELDFCTFIFPSIITRDPLVIAINTSGEAPSISKYMRERIETIIPKNIKEIIEIISKIRKEKNISHYEINEFTRKLIEDN
jgi:precorrin-2 dehydrogenase/sirohydrochlorin ferrochelatase